MAAARGTAPRVRAAPPPAGRKKDEKMAVRADGGVAIAEKEKRFILNRLDRDDLAWQRRDFAVDHHKKKIDVGMHLAYRYEPRPGELWFRFGTIVSVDGEPDEKTGILAATANVTVRLFDPALSYPLNATALGEAFDRRNASLANATENVTRARVVFVDVPLAASSSKKQAEAFTVKSAEKKLLERVLELESGRWWATLAVEWKRQQQASPRHDARHARRDECPAASPAKCDAAIAEALDGLRAPGADACELILNSTDAAFIDAVGARLETLRRKLLWVRDVDSAGLVSAGQRGALTERLLDDFSALGATVVPSAEDAARQPQLVFRDRE
mmetsp:Transcript_16166/g.56516  ORF Transcript_16166/g.56516 Transcript_16166/m.56516 type:complete len:330 (+) Transcript_16166:1-990(+)